jgi:mannose-1-phosphate guanylyltransferase/phosphomannomutase
VSLTVRKLKAAILAGGAGTRLSPITQFIPKCLIPINGRPFLNYVFEYLKKHGIAEVVLLLSPDDANVFENQYGNGELVGMNVSYSVGERRGTASALVDAKRFLDSTFILYYGDVLTNFNLRNMIGFHKRNHADCTLALSRSVPIDYGVGKVTKTGRVIYFEEKPVLKEYPVSMGIHVFEPRILNYCRSEEDIARDVIPRLIKERLRVFGYCTEKRHHDLGSFKHLNEIKAMFEKGNAA